jgi:hypothetical protein
LGNDLFYVPRRGLREALLKEPERLIHKAALVAFPKDLTQEEIILRMPLKWALSPVDALKNLSA